ncbi:unnamed protein product [Effrenium voratum]|nr:unnamed protein product [Effrenium voratum]
MAPRRARLDGGACLSSALGPLGPLESRPDQGLRRGVLVRIRGLKSKPQLNGGLGRCDRLDEQSGPDAFRVLMKAENLFSFDEYIKVAHEGRVPTDIGAERRVLTPQESYDKAQREGRRASPRLSQEEEKSGKYSSFVVKKVDVQAGSLELAIIAPEAKRRPLPTILAISRGEQRHVAKLFRALRAEERGWQLLVPMRSGAATDFIEPAGQTMLEQLLQALLDDRDGEIVPFPVLSNVFHMLGMSHGSAALLSLACKAPDRTGSLNLVTGFLPQFCEVQALRNMKDIRFFVGDQDELGHREYLRGIKESLKEAGGNAHLHIVKGASHYDIGEFIDKEELWQRLELAR